MQDPNNIPKQLIVEETGTSRGNKPLSVSHMIEAAQRRHEQQRQAFSKLITVTADIYTDLHKYEPGEMVTGKLFINCKAKE